MKNILVFLTFLSLISCNEKEDRFSAAIHNGKLFIDNNKVTLEFLIIDELVNNNNSSITRMFQSTAPWNNYIDPTSIIPYKNKYICLFEKGKQSLNKEQVNNITGFYNSIEIPSDEIFAWTYFFVFSKSNNESFLIRKDIQKEMYEYRELWPYLSNYYESKPLTMIILSEEANMKEDSLGNKEFPFQIEEISARLYITNLSDSIITLPYKPETGGYWVIVNGRDSLLLSITDDGEFVNINPNQSVELFFRNKVDSFLPNSTKLNGARKIQELLKDSLFYFNIPKNKNLKNAFISPTPIKVINITDDEMYFRFGYNTYVYDRDGKLLEVI
ncbi:Imm65 family immunity protein [Bacteroides sp. 519]|uniref:Imm65 family immunity protein n=1 Tax=Bacteroides sp. 519 TaxID=2302937 RepID=UPI0013D1DC17|nr:Imm65 family immunity protein [Bacteroides sp. 519]NDV59053.1 hypothetical protein [Bacteroides sp. 519]